MSHLPIVSLAGQGMRIDFIPHSNGEDVLKITTRRDGKHESGWGFMDSVEFYRSAGLTDAPDLLSAEVQTIIDRRLSEADHWPAPVRANSEQGVTDNPASADRPA